MPERPKIVLSASRRTDIPAFYMDWFMAGIRRGYFDVENPFNRKNRRVTVSPALVHTIVFWSKNYGPFLQKGYADHLTSAGYHLFFHFTVNSENNILEPGVPPLDERLGQMKSLTDRFGPESVTWRFDPIVFFRDHAGKRQHNLGRSPKLDQFQKIAETAGKFGVRRCVTSFFDHYRKIDSRLKGVSDFYFLKPAMAEKTALIRRMGKALAEHRIRLSLCCEREVVEKMPSKTCVKNSSCIPNDLLMRLYGGKLSLAKDSGQRRRSGCGCRVSVDIGNYGRQPCHHGCLYCYANPVISNKIPTAHQRRLKSQRKASAPTESRKHRNAIHECRQEKIP